VTNGEAWHELAKRLLDHGYPGGPETQVHLWLGELPDEVAGLIPVPSGWRVVGSSLRRLDLGHPAQTVDVVVDADGESAAAVANFAAAAEAGGWQPHQEERPVHGGFVGGSGSGEVGSFQRGDVLLRVTAIQRPGRRLDIRLHCNTEELRQRRRAPHAVPEAAAHMPQLRAPDGMRLSPRGGGGGMDHYQSDATVDGDATVGDLHTHFARQLEGAQWQLSHQGGDNRAEWSTWQLPDHAWRGFLLVLSATRSRRAALLLRVEAADDDHEDDASFAEIALTR
jgi:hypothetical protein